MSRFLLYIMVAAIAYVFWTKMLHQTPHLDQLAEGYQVIELEPYGGVFRVLRRENYYTGTEAKFSPMDLALGWGEMAKPQVYSKIDISQSNRWYYWHVDEFPIPRRDIETQSANTHIVPANAQVAEQLERVKAGDLIRLQGELIEITGQDGWHWRSSLSREDTGDGACEVMRVDRIDWLES